LTPNNQKLIGENTMPTLRIKNDFHGTEKTVKVRGTFTFEKLLRYKRSGCPCQYKTCDCVTRLYDNETGKEAYLADYYPM
jgi:hypothetical protein